MGAMVRPLIIERRGIGDDREEDAQQRGVADLLGVIGDADGFGKAGVAAADHVIIDAAVARASGKARLDELDALHMGKDAFDAPIAAACEYRGFQAAGGRGVDGGDRGKDRALGAHRGRDGDRRENGKGDAVSAPHDGRWSRRSPGN